MKSILIVEDDITFGMMLQTWLGKKGFLVSSATSIARAKKNLEHQPVDLILSDLRLPDEDGIALLKWMSGEGLHIPLIIMTGYADIQSAVSAIKLGASDYIGKPVNPEELLKKINEALSTKPQKQQEPVTNPPKTTPNNIFIEGKSDAAKKLFNYVSLVAPTTMSVLVKGSSGTGKEYIARRIHEMSNRRDKPFIPIDCGAIPKELAASEFFGHVKGAFTGALTDKTGAFLAANEGTIFLDEIGNLGYEVQIQLLRALQERKIRPVGSNIEKQVDIRLISATNENLENAIGKGSFREDLFHRINEFTLLVPDMKERREDILLFADFFLEQANRELGKNIQGFTAEASSAIQEYHWPGNLRQMKNIIKRATLLTSGALISLEELGDDVLAPISHHTTTTSIAMHDEETEKEQILEALKRTGNNKSQAARLLNIDRKTLYNKIKLYGLDV